MGKIAKFFQKTGVALGALVGSIAIAVNIGLAKAPEMGGTSFFGGLIGTVLVTGAVIAVGTTATVVKLIKDSNEKQKLLGNNGTENNNANAQHSTGGNKENKNIYSSRMNYSNRTNTNSGAANAGERFGQAAANFGEGLGKGAEKLGETLGRGAEKIGEGLNKFFSDSRQGNNRNPNQGGYTNSYNTRPGNQYNGQNAGYQQGGYNTQNNYNRQNGYNAGYNNAGYNNSYNNRQPQNQGQYNNSQYNQNQQFNQNQQYNQNYNNAAQNSRANQNIDSAATTNYFNNAPGDSQYRSGPLKQNGNN